MLAASSWGRSLLRLPCAGAVHVPCAHLPRLVAAGTAAGARGFMASAPSYRETIATLNSLQSNAATLAKQRAGGGTRDLTQSTPQTLDYLARIGVQREDLAKLKAIHVAGSKGKGSTCAMVESMLRAKGLRTGLFTSPHLIEARERIRLDGAPLSKDLFAKYFWVCWDLLHANPPTVENCPEVPPYFRFLTIVAFKTFVEEAVDVAVIEVGIGGRYDATNALQAPVVCGITHLGLEHTSILGNTVAEIAYHKAGIFKPGVQAFTVPQKEEAMPVIAKVAAEVKNPHAVSPPPSAYDGLLDIDMGIGGQHQLENASIALQLAKYWLDTAAGMATPVSDGAVAKGFPLDAELASGLSNCRWPGRSQVMETGDGLTFYMDGAHTTDSCRVSAEWLQGIFDQETEPRRNRVLIFNRTGGRDAQALLEPYLSLGFDRAFFCPNTAWAGSSGDTSSDQANLRVDHAAEMLDVTENVQAWADLGGEGSEQFGTIEEAVNAARRLRKDTDNGVQVLVTGSLHLVGGCMAVLGCEVR